MHLCEGTGAHCVMSCCPVSCCTVCHVVLHCPPCCVMLPTVSCCAARCVVLHCKSESDVAWIVTKSRRTWGGAKGAMVWARKSCHTGPQTHDVTVVLHDRCTEVRLIGQYRNV